MLTIERQSVTIKRHRERLAELLNEQELLSSRPLGKKRRQLLTVNRLIANEEAAIKTAEAWIDDIKVATTRVKPDKIELPISSHLGIAERVFRFSELFLLIIALILIVSPLL